MFFFHPIYNWFSGIIISRQPRIPRHTQRVVDWAASGCFLCVNPDSNFRIAGPESWTSTPTTKQKHATTPRRKKGTKKRRDEPPQKKHFQTHPHFFINAKKKRAQADRYKIEYPCPSDILSRFSEP